MNTQISNRPDGLNKVRAHPHQWFIRDLMLPTRRRTPQNVRLSHVQLQQPVGPHLLPDVINTHRHAVLKLCSVARTTIRANNLRVIGVDMRPQPVCLNRPIRSAVYRRKRIGPKIEPCRTPNRTAFGSDDVDPQRTNCDRRLCLEALILCTNTYINLVIRKHQQSDEITSVYVDSAANGNLCYRNSDNSAEITNNNKLDVFHRSISWREHNFNEEVISRTKMENLCDIREKRRWNFYSALTKATVSIYVL